MFIQPFSLQGYFGYSAGYAGDSFHNSGYGYLSFDKEENIISFYSEFRSSYTLPEESLMYSFDRTVVYMTPYPLSLSLGWERFNWGFGMFYSPADLFNPAYSVLDYERIRKGVLSTGISYEWSPAIIQELVFALPEDTMRVSRENLRFGSRVNVFLNSYECFLSGVFLDDEFPLSCGLRKDVYDYIVYSEATVEPGEDSLNPRFLLGVNRMLGMKGIINIEYYYQYKGISEWNDSIPFLSFVQPMPGYTGKHYIYFLGQTGREGGFSSGIYSVFHPLWRGGLTGLIITYNGLQDITIIGTGIKIIKRGEFSLLPFDSIFGIEMRYFF